MFNKYNKHTKKGNKSEYSVLKNIIKSLQLNNLPPYKKFNLIFSVILAVVIIILNTPVTLRLFENLLIVIGNTFISIFSDKALMQRNDDSTLTSVLVSIVLLIFEIICCMIYCYFAKKLNQSKDNK